jgi:voltage-gated sodium channel
MYETMAVYPMSWLYYLTFIFFTAFAFLNMVIGIVVNVMEKEHAAERLAQLQPPEQPTIADLYHQIQELKSLINAQNRHAGDHSAKPLHTDTF